ncbi:charged multivesicular body protein 7-like [Styela clava]
MQSNTHPSEFTDCWGDDERMNFLFSAFPADRSVNPHHWDNKMAFWKKLIQDMSAKLPYGYVSWDNLFNNLTRQGKRPLGLQTVFDDMIQNGEIVPTAQYTHDIHANQSWVGWGLNWCVKKPASWMADKVLSPIKTRSGRDLKKGQFVIVSALEHKCNEVMAKFHQYASKNEHNHEFLNVVSYLQLQDITKTILCDTESLDLTLATLKNKGIVEIKSKHELISEQAAENNHNVALSEKYIKFAKPGNKKVIPFSDVDIGILQLCETRTHLQQTINNTCQEMESCTQKAKELLKNKQRTMALGALRKKKRLEISLSNKEQNLNNIEELLESLNQCKTDKLLMDTYKSAVAAHKKASKGLSLDVVQSTMDDVANVLDNQSEVSEIISTPVSCENTSDDDLETELAALINGPKDTIGLEDICNKMTTVTLEPGIVDLPIPPTHSPGRTETTTRNVQTNHTHKISLTS